MIARILGRRGITLIAAAVVLILMQVWMDLKIPEYMGEITDHIVLNHSDIVMQKGTEMLILAFGSLLVSFAAGFVLANVSALAGRNMRLMEFETVQSLSVEDISRFTAASLITRSTNDVTQVQNFIARGLQAVIKAPIIAVWGLIKISHSSMEWTAVTAGGMAVLAVMMFATLHFAGIRYRKVQWFTDAVNRNTRENLDGIRVIRAYNAEDHQEERFDRSSRELLDNNVSAIRIMAPSYPVALAMSNFVTVGIYWIGAGLIMGIAGQEARFLKYSDMIVFTSYATMVLTSVLLVFGVMRMVPRARVSYARIREVIETVPSVADGTVTEGKEKGTVEFRGVSFSYPGSGRKALEDISFRVEKGSTVAIIGSTGSGKTTLVDLMLRFHDPDTGSVMVDGVDVRDFVQQSLHDRIGYVPQNAIIFSGSVTMNVNYGDGSDGRTIKDVRRALAVAQAEDFVAALPEQEESHISQKGKNLSGGQKQRIAIARAVCRDPEIYILDDSFSALDYKTDKALREALRRETEGSTVIIVAQRIGTIRDADEILVLDEGRIVGRGKHRQLMESCPLYREIARSQLTEEELL